MRTVTTVTKIYTIDEHPNKQKCFEWIRDNWHDLNEHSVNDVIESLKALKNLIGGKLDWCIGQFPDRSEFITFNVFDKEALDSLDAGSLPLTGVCWDYNVIEGVQNNDVQSILNAIHKDSEYAYSDEGLEELCLANDYEFTEDGEFYSKSKSN